MQIYGMVYRCSHRQAASPIWYENFEQKGAAYTPVFTVLFQALHKIYKCRIHNSQSKASKPLRPGLKALWGQASKALRPWYERPRARTSPRSFAKIEHGQNSSKLGMPICLYSHVLYIECGKRLSLHSSQVAHQAWAYPGFCSMKRLGVFLLSPGWDASPWQGFPKH